MIESTNIEDGLIHKKKKSPTHEETTFYPPLTSTEENMQPVSHKNNTNHFSMTVRRRLLAVNAFKQNGAIKKRLTANIKRPDISKKLDRISRVLFPLMFAFYNVGYFIRYMTNKGFFTETM